MDNIVKDANEIEIQDTYKQGQLDIKQEGFITLKAYIEALQKLESENPNSLFYFFQDYDSVERYVITIQAQIKRIESYLSNSLKDLHRLEALLRQEGDTITLYGTEVGNNPPRTLPRETIEKQVEDRKKWIEQNHNKLTELRELEKENDSQRTH